MIPAHMFGPEWFVANRPTSRTTIAASRYLGASAPPADGKGPASACTVVVKATTVACGRRACIRPVGTPTAGRRLVAGKPHQDHHAALRPPGLLLPSRRSSLKASASPAAASASASGGWKSCQLTAGRIQARASIGRIADIQDPNGRWAEALRALAVTKFRGTNACCPGAGHGVIGNARMNSERSNADRRGGWIAVARQGCPRSSPSGQLSRFLVRVSIFLPDCSLPLSAAAKVKRPPHRISAGQEDRRGANLQAWTMRSSMRFAWSKPSSLPAPNRWR